MSIDFAGGLPGLMLLLFLCVLSALALTVVSVGLPRQGRIMFLGLIWVVLGRIADLLFEIFELYQRLGLQPADGRAIFALVFLLPGTIAVTWGLVSWLPLVRRYEQDRKRRRAAEEELLHSEARFRMLIEQAPEPIVIADAATGLYVDANPAAEKLHGLPRTEWLHKSHPWDFSPAKQPGGQDSKELANHYLQRALAGERVKFDWLHEDPAGNLQECEVSMSRLPTKSKQLVRACVYDMTEHNRAVRALRKAQRAETLTLITGGAAHDFKNLLAAIEGAAELLESDSETDQELKQVILHAARRGNDFTHKLLDYSNQKTAAAKCCDLAQVIEDLAPMLDHALGAAMQIRYDIAPDLWRSRIDAGQFEDAVVNLAFNARDAMGKSGEITLRCSNCSAGPEAPFEPLQAAQGDYVAISVIDRGIGMSKDTLAQAFEPFFTTKKQGEGTGLGLAMVQHFLTQFGGLIDVKSAPGHGTTITLLLPRC